jgi:hypothetical protein
VLGVRPPTGALRFQLPETVVGLVIVVVEFVGQSVVVVAGLAVVGLAVVGLAVVGLAVVGLAVIVLVWRALKRWIGGV